MLPTLQLNNRKLRSLYTTVISFCFLVPVLFIYVSRKRNFVVCVVIGVAILHCLEHCLPEWKRIFIKRDFIVNNIIFICLCGCIDEFSVELTLLLYKTWLRVNQVKFYELITTNVTLIECEFTVFHAIFRQWFCGQQHKTTGLGYHSVYTYYVYK